MELGWKRQLVAVAFVAVLVFMAFAGIVTVASSPAKAATHPFRSLRIGIQNLNIATLNPMKITLVDEYIVVYNVYSTLLTYDKDYHVRGDLAYSWSLASDNVTWTFHLVQGAYFTDPTNPGDTSHKVTADDVVYSYILQNQTSGSIFNSYTKNFRSVTKVDAYTVQIVTWGPFAAMNSAASAIPILPMYVWSAYAKPLNAPIKYPIGSAAMYYDFTNTTASVLVLRKNPGYYGLQYYCQVVRPDEVRYISYTQSSTMVTNFKNGADTLDALVGIDPQTYVNALAQWSPKFAVDTGFVGEFSINVITPQLAAQYGYKYNANPVLLNWTFRQAVAMSINRSALIKDALYGLGNTGDSLVPDSNPWHYPIPAAQQYKFDPVAARALLNSQGWKYDSTGTLNPAATPLYQVDNTGKPINGLVVRFYTLNTDPYWETAAKDIVTWLQATGIQTTDKLGATSPGYGLYSVNQMSGYWLSADYDMWLWDWVFTPASDPSLDVMEVETTGAIGPTSDNYYSNATFDAIYNQSLMTVDLAQRRNLTNTLQSMVYNYASYILPYYKLDEYAAFSPTSARTSTSPPDPGWTNWGNWATSPGLVPDSDLPALWAQLSPLDNQAPVISSFPAAQWVNTLPTSLTVNAQDPEGAALTYTWNFGDGSATATTSSGTTTHTYSTPGNYTATVQVADSEWPVCSSTNVEIIQGGGPGANLPPIIKGLSFKLSHGTFELPSTPITFNLTVNDTEDDPVYVTWDFGDQSSVVHNYLTNTQTDVMVTRTHTYATNGTYNLTVTVTDNKTGILNHSPNATAQVVILWVSPPPNTNPGSSANPLIDFGVPIAIVLVIVVAVTAVVLRRRSARKKEEELDQQPGTPPAGPPPPQP